MKREIGYYWVLLSNGMWWVAEWDGSHWHTTESMNNVCDDSDWKEINENRIPSPDEISDISNRLKEPQSSTSFPEDIKEFVEKNEALYRIFFEYFRATE